MARRSLRDRLADALRQKPTKPLIVRCVDTGEYFYVEHVQDDAQGPDFKPCIIVELRRK